MHNRNPDLQPTKERLEHIKRCWHEYLMLSSRPLVRSDNTLLERELAQGVGMLLSQLEKVQGVPLKFSRGFKAVIDPSLHLSRDEARDLFDLFCMVSEKTPFTQVRVDRGDGMDIRIRFLGHFTGDSLEENRDWSIELDRRRPDLFHNARSRSNLVNEVAMKFFTLLEEA